MIEQLRQQAREEYAANGLSEKYEQIMVQIHDIAEKEAESMTMADDWATTDGQWWS